ncbi:MAG: hypothetical protein Q8L36_00125 [bacterium]|nr:hypothetical protein [bacterium]
MRLANKKAAGFFPFLLFWEAFGVYNWDVRDKKELKAYLKNGE